jgi:hypothetical protein
MRSAELLGGLSIVLAAYIRDLDGNLLPIYRFGPPAPVTE